ncbi:MAG: hypothetical protein ACREON_05330 [Gemmatimonadaceae bacterium]
MLAASATAGTLVGFGMVRGAPAYLLNAVAHLVLGPRAQAIRGFDPVFTLGGALLHLVTLLVYGFVFASLAGRLRGSALALAAVLFAGVAVLLDLVVLPITLRPGFERILSAPELVALYAELALALAVGARLFAPRAVVA